MVAERLTDVIGVVLLIVLGSAGFAAACPGPRRARVAVLVGLVLILWRRPMLALIGWLERGPGRLAELAPKLAEAYESLRIIATPGGAALADVAVHRRVGRRRRRAWVLLLAVSATRGADAGGLFLHHRDPRRRDHSRAGRPRRRRKR